MPADEPMTPIGGELSENDYSAAVTLLDRILKPSDLRQVFEAIRGQGQPVEWLVAGVETGESGRVRTHLADDELAPLLVDILGTDLMSERKLRYMLAFRCATPVLEDLNDYTSTNKGYGGRQSKATAIAQRNWHPGKSWSTHFVGALGFPPVFAGAPGLPREPDSMEIIPFVPLPALEDFQDDLKRSLLRHLRSAPGKNRAILTLPTGAGKTRTAVEALLEWRISQEPRPSILWIAQTEELCEQAVQAFREVWFDLGHRKEPVREVLRIGRLWSDRPVPTAGDVVVASIQKLASIFRDADDDRHGAEMDVLADGFAAIVIDEAHRAQARSYTTVLRALGINLRARTRTSETPLIGLTATPFRSTAEETVRLHKRFHNVVLSATGLGAVDVATALREREVLSEVELDVIRYGGTHHSIDGVRKYEKHYDDFEDIHPDLLRAIGEERRRNIALLERVLELPADWPVLLFGCSVEHAQALTVLLRRRGRRAACVTGETRSGARRAMIEQFRSGQLKVLCNYGVLTTGFDAPQVRAVVVARPTASPLLYEQMIGRGMRGRRFGGTDKCLVIDVEDNIRYRNEAIVLRFPDVHKPSGQPE